MQSPGDSKINLLNYGTFLPLIWQHCLALLQDIRLALQILCFSASEIYPDARLLFCKNYQSQTGLAQTLNAWLSMKSGKSCANGEYTAHTSPWCRWCFAVCNTITSPCKSIHAGQVQYTLTFQHCQEWLLPGQENTKNILKEKSCNQMQLMLRMLLTMLHNNHI